MFRMVVTGERFRSCQTVRVRMQTAERVPTGVWPNADENEKSRPGAGIGQHCQPLWARANDEPD